jgi:uncharacterized repeat protein (TIGR01451 family)
MNTLMNYQHFMFDLLSICSLWGLLGGNALQASTQEQVVTDLSIKMVADRNMVEPGEQVTYTATMTNLGPDDASLVDVAFDTSEQLTVVSIACDHGISSDGSFCEYSSLAAGESVVSTVVATPKLGANRTHRTVVRNAASILFETADTFDPVTVNNKAGVKTWLVVDRSSSSHHSKR